MIDPLLSGKRVRLTAMEDGDLGAVASWHGDAGFMRRLSAAASFPRSESELKKWLEKSRESPLLVRRRVPFRRVPCHSRLPR
ncbi:hypothetical protein C8P63_11927 [Melghirimyces profundicolus]|uniref:Acetyltransferase (GNAT) family protein n=1 Tax=Melghirimyces profundicolus TaxID=1242148 RepID=A0A2T6BGY1_9BACL|nr:hypothetical protein [Melghirimyces profundicolus]PTX55320.1 hypothetical protein C8P63_11927 [Melghirimyces profundicolus]